MKHLKIAVVVLLLGGHAAEASRYVLLPEPTRGPDGGWSEWFFTGLYEHLQ